MPVLSVAQSGSGTPTPDIGAFLFVGFILAGPGTVACGWTPASVQVNDKTAQVVSAAQWATVQTRSTAANVVTASAPATVQVNYEKVEA